MLSLLPHQIVMELLQGLRLKIGKHRGKIGSKPDPLLLDKRQKVIREAFLLATFHLIEHLFHIRADRHRRDAGSHPTVEAESRQLTLQNRHGVKKHPRRLHLTLHHLQRLFKEELIVWIAFGQGDIQGVAIFTPGTANALQIVGLRRWHRTEQHAREIAHIDTHLQGRGG